MVPKTLISFLFLLVLPGAALAVSDAYQSLSMDLVVKAEDDISAARSLAALASTAASCVSGALRHVLLLKAPEHGCDICCLDKHQRTRCSYR